MKQSASFLPEDFVVETRERRTGLLAVVLFPIMILAVFAAFLVTNRQWTEVRAAQASVDQETERVAREISEMKSLEKIRAQMDAKAELARGLLEGVLRAWHGGSARVTGAVDALVAGAHSKCVALCDSALRVADAGVTGGALCAVRVRVKLLLRRATAKSELGCAPPSTRRRPASASRSSAPASGSLQRSRKSPPRLLMLVRVSG
jgi:hypothetical protein